MISLISLGADTTKYEHLLKETSIYVHRIDSWEALLSSIRSYHFDGILFLEPSLDNQERMLELQHLGYDGLYLISHRNTISLRMKHCEKTVIADITNLTEHLLRFMLDSSIKNRQGQIRYKIPLIGNSEPIQQVKEQIISYASSDEPVLVLGETGTGKSIVAKSLHEYSKTQGSFLNVNCSTLGENLFESELFGFVKGSFTGANRDKKGFFEWAMNGTLFLDEIGEIPVYLQPKLLKVIEEKEYHRIGHGQPMKTNARIICATNRNIYEKENRFRKDLLYRISTFVIHIPPLRDRPEDIPDLVYYYLKDKAPDFTITEESLKIIMDHEWPGNVRELFSFMARCVLYFKSVKKISLSHKTFDTLYHHYQSMKKERLS